MATKVEVKNLTKVFGKSPKKVLKHIEEGISKEDLLKKTGHTVGINNVSFEVEEGETFVIMGLSGSGKSTLIRCLNLLNKPTAGEIVVNGQNILDYDPKQLRAFRQNTIAMVFQHFGLLNHRTVLENIEFGLEVRGVAKEKRYRIAKQTLNSVGLKGWGDSYIHSLSGGMKQRVGLARALANDPEILLMDEPFSALDPLIRGDMHEELLDLQSELKKTIIFITHDVNEAFLLGDRIAVLKDGDLIQVGTQEDFFENPANEYIENFIRDIDRTRVLKSENIMRGPRLRATLSMSPKVLIREMEDKDMDFCFVVDQHRVLQGLVTVDDALRAIEEKESVREVVRDCVKTVSLDSYIKDIVQDAMQTEYPLAVVNEKNQLRGVIPRSAILRALV